MQIALKGLVGLIGLLLGVIGIRWMLAPSNVAAELGIQLGDAVALSTARGDVGGLFIGGALLCALGLARANGLWLQAGALLLGCVAVGRVIGIVVDGFTPQAALAISVELVMLAVLLLAAKRMARTT